MLRLQSNQLLSAFPLLLMLGGCIDLTPPWEKNRGRDAADAEGAGGAFGGAGGVGGSGGTGGTTDTGGTGGSDSVDAAVPPSDADLPDSPFAIDGLLAPASDAEDAPLLSDTRLTDARVDRHGAEAGGGSSGDAAIDRHVEDAGGAGGRGGRTTGGAATGGNATGGTAGSATKSGGSVTPDAGSATGGTGGSTTPDAGSSRAGDGGITRGLIAYYPCDQSAGPTLTDLSGNKKDGTLSGGYAFSAGKFGNGLSFTAANKGYASLPADMLAAASEVTIATWVYLETNPNWQRVWDFGKDSNVYMFLTTNSYSHLLYFGISKAGNTAELGVATDALPLTTWKHVAVVLNASGATLYVDGQQKSNDPAVDLRPADLATLPNYYIGRSQFSSDPYLDGKVDDFRIYNRALSAEEIQALLAGP